METTTLSLIGTVDALIYVLKTDKKAQKSKDARGALKRLERVRDELVAEGLRYSQTLGAVRACISEVATQLQSILSRQRDLQGVLQGLVTVARREIEPPPPPSSSSSGPKALSPPGATELGRAVVNLKSTPRRAAARAIKSNRLMRADGKP